jgi:hypothetical protein
MPRLQDIERFKSDLASLSKEAEVLERWGEKPEIITPPEGAAATGEAAPSSFGARATGKTPSAEEQEGMPPDFAALLEDLPIDREEDAAPVDEDISTLLGSAEGEELGPQPAEPLDLDSIPDFDMESAAGETGLAAASMPGGIEKDEALAASVEPAEREVFEFETPEFPAGPAVEAPEPAEGNEALEALPLEEAPPELPAEGGPAEGAGSRAEDFSIPDISLADEAPAAEEALGIPESLGETFSIPDLDSSSKAEKGPEIPAPDEALGLGTPEPGEDAFETFSFEEPSEGAGFGGAFGDSAFGGEGPASDLGGGGGRDLDSEIAALSEEAPIADTFKIDQDWGDFGSTGAEGGPPRQPPPKAKAPPVRAPAEKFKPVELSEAQVDSLQDSLLSFPLNLRIAVEDILANERGGEAQQSKLVWALVDGMDAEEVALLAGRILKRHIPIPKGREKRTGAALEAEKGTLAYALVHTLLPVFRIGLLVLAAAAALGYLGWRYIYVPLAADSLYRTGYQRIADDRYPEAETDFEKATEMREFVPWYYRYAEAYAAKRQYILAEKKYASLIEAHPKEKEGILAWARLEREQLKYEEAVEVLKGAPRSEKSDATRGMTGLLSWDYFNEAGLLLLGDVYLDWAEEAPSRYEDARRTYATLIERYGDKDTYLERMLLYFIRVDRLSEVLPLKAHFLADPKREALSAEVLAELGGYLLDKDMIDDVRDILLSAAKKDPAVPESHYHLARYFDRMGDPTEERKALDNAISAFAALPGLGGRRTGMYIDSLIWRARFLAQAKEWIGAERDYAAAASEYEKALELRRVKKGPRFGEAYAGLADVAYWQRDDLESALALYDRAAANGYVTADTSYKTGNILYRTGRYQESLERFFEAGAQGAVSPYLDYAFGSALYARSDLFSAEAYYRKSSAAMEKELADEGDPAPQERPSQVEILRLYMKSENNLGVALYRSAARSGDSRRRNEAMAVLTHAVKLYDQLAQEPSALAGAESEDLGLENINTLLTTGRGDKLLVYTEIEKDLQFPKQE